MEHLGSVAGRVYFIEVVFIQRYYGTFHAVYFFQVIGDSAYEMRLFEDSELEIYKNDLTFEVSNADKTIYEKYVPLDSSVESEFAKAVLEDDKRVYFVAETKETGTPSVDIYKLRIEEQQKIKCAEAHFRQFNDVKYRVVNKVGDLLQ